MALLMKPSEIPNTSAVNKASVQILGKPNGVFLLFNGVFQCMAVFETVDSPPPTTSTKSPSIFFLLPGNSISGCIWAKKEKQDGNTLTKILLLCKHSVQSKPLKERYVFNNLPAIVLGYL